jgi:hypothetical protein
LFGTRVLELAIDRCGAHREHLHADIGVEDDVAVMLHRQEELGDRRTKSLAA